MNGKRCLIKDKVVADVMKSARLNPFPPLKIREAIKLYFGKNLLLISLLLLSPISIFAQYSHIVQPKETLYTIAQKYSLNHLTLAQTNQLDNEYTLEKGQVIFLKRKASRLTFHTVRRGDTLYAIAKSYNYPLEQLATINSLNNEYNLEKGQKIYFDQKYLPPKKKKRYVPPKIEIESTKPIITGRKPQKEVEKKQSLVKSQTKPTVKKPIKVEPIKQLSVSKPLNKKPEVARVKTDILTPQSTQEFVKLIRQAKKEVISGARFILGKKQLKILSLQQSLNLGLEKSLSIQQQKEQLFAAKHALSASEAQLDPSLNLALTYSRSRQFSRSEFFTRERQVQTDTYIVPDALDRFEQDLKDDFQKRLVASGLSGEQAEVVVNDVFASQAWQQIYGADKEPVAGSFRFEVEQILRNEVFGSDPGLLTQDIFERTITPAYESFVQEIQDADIFPDFYNENSFNSAYFGQRNGNERLDDSSSFLYDIEGAALSSAVVYDKTTVFDDEVLEIEGIEIPTIIIDNAIVGGDGNCIARDGKVFIRNEDNSKWIAADPADDLAYIKSFCGYSRSNYRREEFASTDSPYVESYDLDLELAKDFWWGSQLKINAATHKARPGYNLGNLYSALSVDSPFCLGDDDPTCLPGTFRWYSTLKLELNTPLPYSKNFGSDGNRAAVDIQLSESNLVAQDDALKQTNNMVLANISSAYWALTKALGEVQIAQKQIDILAKMKENISRQYQQREVTEYNYNQILTSYENALNQNELAWNNYLLASNLLAEQLNLAPELVLVPDLSEQHLIESFQPIAVSEAFDYALEFHPQRLFLKQKLFDKGLELRFYQNQNKPDITLGLVQQYNQDNTVMGYDSFSDSMSNLFNPDVKDFYIGLNYSYPIGNRANKAALSKARIAKQQAQSALDNNDLELKINIRDSINNLNNALARFELSSQQLKVSKESFAKVEQYSEQKQASEFERLQSLQTLLSAQQNYIDNFVDRHLALNQLKAAKGEYACYNQSC